MVLTDPGSSCLDAKYCWEGKSPACRFALDPVAFTPDVQHVAVVRQPVQDSRGDDGVAQQFAPLAEVLVGGEEDDAPLLAG